MSPFKICRRGAQVSALCGPILALLLASGCGPKAAPSGSPKPKADAPKATPVAAAQTNLAAEYTSVFEDLPSRTGRDPFYPTSHRRDPAPEATTEIPAHVDPVLVLRAILRTSTHSQAVINNQFLEKGEEQPVRVPSGHVRVRCLEIGNDYVVIQVEGEAEPKRLVMEQKKY